MLLYFQVATMMYNTILGAIPLGEMKTACNRAQYVFQNLYFSAVLATIEIDNKRLP